MSTPASRAIKLDKQVKSKRSARGMRLNSFYLLDAFYDDEDLGTEDDIDLIWMMLNSFRE